MKHVIAATALAIVVMSLGGCNQLQTNGKSDSSKIEISQKTASIKVSIPLSESTSITFSKAIISIYDGEKKLIEQTLTVGKTSIDGVVSNIPAGKKRIFKMDLISADGTIVYSGSSISDVNSGELATVSIVLRKTSGSGSAVIIGKIEDPNIDTIPDVIDSIPNKTDTCTMVLDFPFTGNAHDYSGYNNNGRLTGSYLSPDRFGNANSAYTFGGYNSNYYYNTNAIFLSESPVNSSTNVNSGTIISWVKTTDSTPNYCGVVVKQNAFGLFLYGGRVSIYDWSKVQRIETSVSVNDNKWHQLAVVFNSGQINGTKIYVDGACVLTTDFTVCSQYEGITIGSGYNPEGAQQFTGSIDDVSIYKAQLDSKAIGELYHLGGWGR